MQKPLTCVDSLLSIEGFPEIWQKMLEGVPLSQEEILKRELCEEKALMKRGGGAGGGGLGDTQTQQGAAQRGTALNAVQAEAVEQANAAGGLEHALEQAVEECTGTLDAFTRANIARLMGKTGWTILSAADPGALGMQPRERQSIVWEAVRALYSPADRTAYLAAPAEVDALWVGVRSGAKLQAEAQLEMAR